MSAAPQEYQVRLRHVQGDLGPFTLPVQTTVPELAELACAEWPTEGPLSETKPSTPAEIKLISSGRFVENSQTLGSIAQSLGVGVPAADYIITLHLILRAPGSAKSGSSFKGGGGGGGGEAAAPRRCCTCVIS